MVVILPVLKPDPHGELDGAEAAGHTIGLTVTGTTLVAVLPHELVAVKLNVVVPFAQPADPHAYPIAVGPVGPLPVIAPVQLTIFVIPVPPVAFQFQDNGVPAVTLALDAPLTDIGNVMAGQALIVTGTTLVALFPHELVAVKLNVVVPIAQPAEPHAYPIAVAPVGPVPVIAPVQLTIFVIPVPPVAFQSQDKGVFAITLALDAPLTAIGKVTVGQTATQFVALLLLSV